MACEMTERCCGARADEGVVTPKEIGERLKMKSEVVRQRKSRAIRKAQKVLRAYLSRE